MTDNRCFIEVEESPGCHNLRWL